jgi:hypothetical protein
MPTKPYSLQSPEQIAKDYAGNKQKIAQAAQSGLLDPTAAVMAGMFIDRMRSAQTQEQGPPSTVAQQVFAPPPPPMQMGAMPPSAPMGAPPQGAPPPPMGAPPVGMAGGGLTTLPLPDNMFNEPDGMGYANGGIVAFADGGATDEDPAPIGMGEMFQRMFSPTTEQLREAREDTIAAGRAGRARREAEETARASRRLPTPTPPFRSRDQNPTSPAQGPTRYGPKESTAAPDDKPGVMIPPPRGLSSLNAMAAMEPRPAAPGVSMEQLQAALKGGITPRPAAPLARPMTTPIPGAPPAAPRVGVAPAAPRVGGLTPAGPALSASPAAAPAGPQGMQAGIAEYMNLDKTLGGGSVATPMRDRVAAAAEAQLDPKVVAAGKKQDLWQAVAQFGFNMAATNSPYFLQAAGQAGAATVPAMAAMRKERKAMERDALKQLADIEGLTVAEKRQALQGGVAYAQNLADDQRQDSQFAANYDLANRKFELEKRLALREPPRGGGGGGGGGGGATFKDTPEGQAAAARYAEIMLRKDVMLARDPKLRAAYRLNPQKYDAAYEATARRNAYEYAASLRQSGRPVDPQQQMFADLLRGGNTPPAQGGGEWSNLKVEP